MQHWNVIVMPDQHSRVRRFRVPVVWLRRAPWIAGAALLVALGISGWLLADWARLRAEAVEVEALRSASLERQAALEQLSGRLGELEESFERVREFERKVRVIANLPSAIPEAALDPSLDGQGGPDPELDADQRALFDRLGTALPAVRDAGLADESDVARLEQRREALAYALGMGMESFDDLVLGLEGKTDLLESTPSVWPSAGWVTSGYGWRTSPFTGRRQFHHGIDIAARHGTPVIAPARGRVRFVGRKGPLGRSVVIDHGHGITTTYGHNSETFVSKGDVVERGARIAAIGSTGRSTGPHLHYAIEIDGEAVDPRRYILD